jgi:hypothetical protein
MDAQNGQSDERSGASRDGAAPEVGLDDVLLTRLERIVALAGRRGEPALHEELLDELRSLVREAESLRPSPPPSQEEVVERPARRQHGT